MTAAFAVLALGAAFSPSAHADDGVAVSPTVVVDPAPVDPAVPAAPPPAVIVTPSVPEPPSTPPTVVPEPVSPAIPPVVSPSAPAADPAPAADGTPSPVSPARPLPAVPVPAPPAAGTTEAPSAPDVAPAVKPSGDTNGNTVSDNSASITDQAVSDASMSGPQTWVWNWSWNCDKSTLAAPPQAPAGSTVWLWNWQWACAESPGVAPDVPTSCVQCNLAVSIRVASPGDDGPVTQSNQVVASATTYNVAAVTQKIVEAAAEAPVLPLPPQPALPDLPIPAVAVAPPVIPAPAIPPPPIVGAPPLPPSMGGIPTRGLATLAPRWAGGTSASATVLAETHRSVVRRKRGSSSRSVVRVETHTSTRVVLVQRSSSARSSRPAAKPHAGAGNGRPARPASRVPFAPFAPSGPAAAGTVGGAAHDGGSGVLTAAIVGALAFLAIALLSVIAPASLSVRRRLSDDRRARPG